MFIYLKIMRKARKHQSRLYLNFWRAVCIIMHLERSIFKLTNKTKCLFQKEKKMLNMNKEKPDDTTGDELTICRKYYPHSPSVYGK